MKKIVLFVMLMMTFGGMQAQYQYLGTFNTSNGVPDYLEAEGDVISEATLELINSSLPESYPVPVYNPHYIAAGYDTDVLLDEAADVWVTYVTEGAGYKNVLGFYTYDIATGAPESIEDADITIIFPNVSNAGSGGGLQPGDKVQIGTFEAGTGIGWVLLANAWSPPTVGNGLWKLFSNPDYNPEADENLRYHNVLLQDPDNERVILGFEDIRRDYSSCDNDFNDAIFYITSNPYTAMRTTNYADVSSSYDVTSANDGGLESNGHLASLIAKRNFRRTKSGLHPNQKTLQATYNKAAIQLTGKMTNTTENAIDFYLPDTGMFGTEMAYVSSPNDLIDITNAAEVFSLDMYSGETRVAAVLATETTEEVYDHTKIICDRLNSSSLNDVRTVVVQGHQIVSAKIERADGTIENTLSFSIKLGEFSNELHSYWNIDEYPEGEYYNFQLWGSSFSQVFTIANHIIDTLEEEKPLTSTSSEDRVPDVFVKSGYYFQGALHLEIINKTGVSSMNFDGNISETELSETTNTTETISLNGDYEQSVVIETGMLFDIGFSLSASTTTQIDALYLADGPWGVDFLAENASVDNFSIAAVEVSDDEDIYPVEREPSISGSVMGTVNLFRHVLAGDQSLDVSDYSALEFSIQNTQPIEIVLMQQDLADWDNRYRYTIAANESMTDYVIPFSEFTDGDGNTADITDVKTIVFSVGGNYVTYQNFSIDLQAVAFSNSGSLSVSGPAAVAEASIVNYPNPFKGSTNFKLPEATTEVYIEVYDMVGRRVVAKTIENINGTMFTFPAPELKRGIFQYQLTDDKNNRYTGRFMVK